MEKQNWQDEAIKDSGIKVPEWELEGTGTEQKEAQEGAVEEMRSAAETRMAELAAETQAATPESLVEKAAQTEALRAEIAEMDPKALEIPVEKREIEITDEASAV